MPYTTNVKSFIFIIILFMVTYMYLIQYDNEMLSNTEILNIRMINNDDIIIYNKRKYCFDRNNLKYISVMGLPNTGTHALQDLLHDNCYTLWNESVLKMTKFSRHEMYPSIKDINDIDTNALYVIIIKDPLTWWKSISKYSYTINFVNVTESTLIWFNHEIFKSVFNLYNLYYLSWLDLNNFTIGFNHDLATDHFNNLMDKYLKEKYQERKQNHNTYSSKYIKEFVKFMSLKDGIFDHNGMAKLYDDKKEYLNYIPMNKESISYVIIKFEDLLFRPYEIGKELCKCVNGVVNGAANGTIMLGNNYSKQHGNFNNVKTRSELLELYSNDSYRYSGINNEIFHLINSSINSSIIEIFGYKI